MPATDLRVPSLARLHARRSQKWEGYDCDVLVSTIAEMDFPLAPPVAAALHAAIDRDDVGYAPAAPLSLREAFAGFAQRRLAWRVDPEQVTLVPDVMAGILEVARLLAGPRQTVAFATPAYPPFFAEPPGAGLAVREIAMLQDGALDLDALDAELATGTRVLVLANPLRRSISPASRPRY